MKHAFPAPTGRLTRLFSLCVRSSQSGVVNVYSQQACLRETVPKPLKAIMNLVTTATALRFNPSSEILAIASRADDEANRLVRLWHQQTNRERDRMTERQTDGQTDRQNERERDRMRGRETE